MSARGRPIRFVGLVCVAWIGARVVLLWPQTGSLPEAIKALVPLAGKPMAEPPPVVAIAAPVARKHVPQRHRSRPPRSAAVAVAPTLYVLHQVSIAPPAPPILVAQAPVQTVFAPPAAVTDRWSAGGWFVARGGSGTGAAPGGQLGGGQAGARIAYLLAPRQRIAAFARVAAPLAGKGSEAAFGIEWQPGKAPIRLAIEQRIGIDGASGGTGAGITAGLFRETHGLRIEGYGQAGAIARARIEPYADGAIRITRPVAPPLSLGAGAWGGAQRGAQRLDIGPSATLALGEFRVSLDWRQRVAGRAAPGSGLAVTLGGDF